MTIAVVLVFFTALNGHAQDASLTVAPKKCVALNKGQVCYQFIRIQFKSTEKVNFCLTVNEQAEPLQCWHNSEEAEYRYRLASSSDVEFKIIDSENITLANALVSVAWVYKQSRKRNRWRLF